MFLSLLVLRFGLHLYWVIHLELSFRICYWIQMRKFCNVLRGFGGFSFRFLFSCFLFAVEQHLLDSEFSLLILFLKFSFFWFHFQGTVILFSVFLNDITSFYYFSIHHKTFELCWFFFTVTGIQSLTLGEKQKPSADGLFHMFCQIQFHFELHKFNSTLKLSILTT